MAKGDIITQKVALSTVFQPASGVEIVIRSMSCGAAQGAGAWRYWDGAAAGGISAPGVENVKTAEETSVWVGITNSLYIKNSAAEAATFSGVQVK